MRKIVSILLIMVIAGYLGVKCVGWTIFSGPELTNYTNGVSSKNLQNLDSSINETTKTQQTNIGVNNVTSESKVFSVGGDYQPINFLADVNLEHGWKKNFENAKVLDFQKVFLSPDIKKFKTISLIEVDMRYPYLRVEEEFEYDSETQELKSVSYIESVANHLLVKIDNNSALNKIEELSDDINIRHLSTNKYIVEFTNFGLYTVPDAVTIYSGITDLRYAEPDYVLHTTLTPNDPNYGNLWGLHNGNDNDIDAPEAWDITTGNSSVVIGVIDTGVDYNHNDLSANMWTNSGETPGNGIDDDSNGYIDDVYGYDFYNYDSDPYDDDQHGTHCAGTITGAGNNGVGVTGVAWNSKIMALKFLNANGSGYTSGAILCVEYATDNGAHVTSNSWGGGGYSQSLKDAIDDAGNNEILFIAAAGNSSTNNDSSPHYPSSYTCGNIVAVASTTSSDSLSGFSCYGASSVDVGAPGSSIYSTVPGNSYAYLSGTSMATPHVSGVVALLLDEFPSESMDEIKNRVMYSGDRISALSGITTTGRRINAYNALTLTYSKAAITSPSNSSTLSSGTETFTFNDGSGVSRYCYWLGSSQGSQDLGVSYAYGNSFTVNVPTNGSTVYVRLFSELEGSWAYNDYSYTASGSSGGTKSAITSPSDSSTLSSGTQTFTYTSGTNVTRNCYWLGSSQGASDLGVAYVYNNSFTATVPTDGSTVYLRFFSEISGSWEYNDYSYTASSAGGTKSAITSPSDSSTLSSGTQTFAYTSGTNVTRNCYWLGSSQGASDLGVAYASNNSFTATVPTDGSTLYVRFFSEIDGSWEYNDYSYTTFSGASVKSEITSPANNSTFNSSLINFSFSAGSGITRNAIWLGSSQRVYDYGTAYVYNGSFTLSTPTDGSTVYIRLWSEINGSWQYNDYSYTCSN